MQLHTVLKMTSASKGKSGRAGQKHSWRQVEGGWMALLVCTPGMHPPACHCMRNDCFCSGDTLLAPPPGRMLDCAALLALEQLPLVEEVNANPALDVFDVTRAWSEQMCLLCLLLRTQRTQALALAHGAGAAVGRALAGSLVSSSWD